MAEEEKNLTNGSGIGGLNGNTDGNADVTYFAQTNFRGERKSFGIRRPDRSKHMYIIGKTGMGKSTVEENMAIQDIQRGEGVGVVDPHGQFAEKMLDFVPKERVKDVIYFCPQDTDWPMAFNIMEDVGMEHRHLVASGLMGVFKKIWPDVWSARMEYILNNAILALLEYPDSTILGINRMLSDKDYRKEVVSKISDPTVKAFWEQEFAKYTDRFMTEAGAAIQNKIGQFISNPLIRNIIGQPKSSFDMRKVMDEKKILIMNLAKGRIGEDNSRLIGAMLITKLYLGAMSRVDVPENKRSDFYLYVDEFQNFATESFKDILSESRKYKLNLILAHQYIAQMDEKVRDAVFGNVGTIVIFRIGAFDAEVLEKEFSPDFMATDIVNLGFANIYLKLMIDGVASRPFSAMTLPPIPKSEKSYLDEIIKSSREHYAGSKEEVEKRISEWHAPVIKAGEPAAGEAGRPERPSRPRERAESFSREPAPERPGPQLYQAICTNCGAATQVPFQPDAKRPVYCRDCKEKFISKAAPAATAAPRRPSFSPAAAFRESAAEPVFRRVPRFEEGEIVQKKVAPERISLSELQKNKPPIKKQKQAPDLGGLRQALEGVLEKNDEVPAKEIKKDESENETSGNAKKTLRPGDSIKF